MKIKAEPENSLLDVASQDEIEVEGLTKSFGHFTALRGVSLSLPKGCFLTIMGPNGAGKTTLIRVLATLARPTSGRVSLCGFDLSRESVDARRLLGVVLHQTLLYDDLTAEQNLRFYGRLYRVPELNQRILEVAEEVGLALRLRDPVRTFSRGMQQRLAIARAILHNPSIMLLDEPDTGLDIAAAVRLKEILRRDSTHQRTVLMVTHNLERGLQACDRAAIMRRGRIVYMSNGKIDVDSFRDAYYEYTGLRES
ncbi:MAG: ABC transporter ATP-binding protein [Candidatus Marsarchaeota archaeon]|nr:ABC transporter ATP-binding protein [Candidatus Marsarchaeota archaeon]